jgi:hypothetical protein
VKHEPPTQSLHCSHFVGRAGKSTRWDEDNAAALCYGCHRYFTANPVEHRDFFFKRLGENRYNDLVVRSHIPMKADEKLMAIYWKERVAQHEQNRP